MTVRLLTVFVQCLSAMTGAIGFIYLWGLGKYVPAVLIIICTLLVIFIVWYIKNQYLRKVIYTKYDIDITDPHGKEAKITKTQIIKPILRPLEKRVVRHISAEGGIEDWDVYPGEIKSMDNFWGYYEIEIEYNPPLRAWRKTKTRLSWKILDSFLKDEEGFIVTCDLETKKVDIEIHFPKERPCKECWGAIVVGALEERVSAVKMAENGRRINWRIKKGVAGNVYRVRWRW